MKDIPQNIRRLLKALRLERGKYVQAVRLGDNYYVYEATTFYDRGIGKGRKVSSYIGKIGSDGVFRPKRQRIVQGALPAKTEAEIVAEHEALEEVKPSDFQRERDILMALSMDGRVSMSQVGKVANLSTSAAAYQVKKLEAKYGIKYVPEIDVGKLGYSKYIVMVKFISGMPDAGELTKMLFDQPTIQFAVLTNGRYDLVFYMLAKSNEELSSIQYNMVKEIGEKFRSKILWNASPFYQTYGFIKVRDEFVHLLRNDIWSRTTGVPVHAASLTKNEYLVLKELNKSGNESFIEMDKKNGMTRMSSYYAYSRLLEKGIVERVTLSMEKMKIRYTGVVIFRITDQYKFESMRPDFMRHLITYTNNPINRYILIGDLISMNGVIAFIPVFEDQDLESSLSEIKNISSKRDVLIVTKVLFGSAGYRLFDNKASNQAQAIK